MIDSMIYIMLDIYRIMMNRVNNSKRFGGSYIFCQK
jgi:hypothetical protein